MQQKLEFSCMQNPKYEFGCLLLHFSNTTEAVEELSTSGLGRTRQYVNQKSQIVGEIAKLCNVKFSMLDFEGFFCR